MAKIAYIIQFFKVAILISLILLPLIAGPWIKTDFTTQTYMYAVDKMDLSINLHAF